MTLPIWLALTTQLVSLSGDGGVVTLVEREAWVMGTRLTVVAEAPGVDRATRATERVLAEVERLDGLLSTWSPSTEVGRMNRAPMGERRPLSPEVHALMVEGWNWSQVTDGAFQPGVGPLIDAWDLRGEGRVPTEEELRRALEASSHQAWSFAGRDSRVERRHPLAWIDTGAFGKGAALRSAASLLGHRGGADIRVLVDLGGQVWAGAPEERPWTVPVAHPADRGVPVAQLRLHDASAATSGTSERPGHILDPRTGRPAPAWGTVTVVHPDPLVADVLATALYVMGPEQGLEWLATREDVGALFLEVLGSGLRSCWTPAMDRWLAVPPEPAGRTPTCELKRRSSS